MASDSPAIGAAARSARDIRGPTPLLAIEGEPPPVLIVDPEPSEKQR